MYKIYHLPTGFIIKVNLLENSDLFRLMDCEKIHISIVFVNDLSKNQLIFSRNGEWKNYDLLKLLISYVFVKKSNFFLQC